MEMKWTVIGICFIVFASLFYDLMRSEKERLMDECTKGWPSESRQLECAKIIMGEK